MDEPIAADDRVVTSYTFEGEKRDGGKEGMAVMAIWRLEDGNVKSLHEVDAPEEEEDIIRHRAVQCAQHW